MRSTQAFAVKNSLTLICDSQIFTKFFKFKYRIWFVIASSKPNKGPWIQCYLPTFTVVDFYGFHVGHLHSFTIKSTIHVGNYAMVPWILWHGKPSTCRTRDACGFHTSIPGTPRPCCGCRGRRRLRRRNTGRWGRKAWV